MKTPADHESRLDEQHTAALRILRNAEKAMGDDPTLEELRTYDTNGELPRGDHAADRLYRELDRCGLVFIYNNRAYDIADRQTYYSTF